MRLVARDYRISWRAARSGDRLLYSSRDDCWDLAQEAMKFYWRRMFLTKEYALAEQDARSTVDLDLYQYAEAEEDRQMAEQHTPQHSASNSSTRTFAFDGEEHKKALGVIRGGIVEIEDISVGRGGLTSWKNVPSSISYASGKRK